MIYEDYETAVAEPLKECGIFANLSKIDNYGRPFKMLSFGFSGISQDEYMEDVEGVKRDLGL